MGKTNKTLPKDICEAPPKLKGFADNNFETDEIFHIFPRRWKILEKAEVVCYEHFSFPQSFRKTYYSRKHGFVCGKKIEHNEEYLRNK